jgi:UDP-GlcNAc3NAcA epimerase
MKVVSVVGARPQFIKCAPVSRELRKSAAEVLIHTGQHYDANLSDVFFRDLDIPAPDHHLGVGSGPHGDQTGRMLKGIEEVLLRERPDVVLVYGDTNSTLAGALAAAKLHIPVAHVEAGLRSYNRRMPEEINRILTDHVASLLFCPSPASVDNLAREGIQEGVHLVGDVMYDSLTLFQEAAEGKSSVLDRLQLRPGKYFLATVHRAENTDDPIRLRGILNALEELARAGRPVVFPMHPRLKARAEALGWKPDFRILQLDPLPYLDLIHLQKHSRVILTDSGGIQKEAYWMKAPCVTLRDETEWVETVREGWNALAGAGTARIVSQALEFKVPATRGRAYGEKGAARRIVETLLSGDSMENKPA